MASLIEYDRRPFGNRTLDFVRLNKFYCEFDYVPLPNPIDQCSIGFDYRTVELDTPGRKDKAIHSSSGRSMRDAKNPQLKMSKQPQIQRRIQSNMYLLYFTSLAKQSGHCNRRQEAFCFKKSMQKDAEEPCTFPPRHTTVEITLSYPCLVYKLLGL